MFDALWQDSLGWWATVTPEFAFLLALVPLVAAAGLAGDAWRARRRRTRGR